MEEETKVKEEEEELEVLTSDKYKVTNCHVAQSCLLLLACSASLQNSPNSVRMQWK